MGTFVNSQVTVGVEIAVMGMSKADNEVDDGGQEEAGVEELENCFWKNFKQNDAL